MRGSCFSFAPYPSTAFALEPKAMDRRELLGAGAAGLALSALGGYHAAAADDKPLRVGLIGCGWYGKCDLFRLIQVAPVEVVSLCDVDQQMLAEAADLVAAAAGVEEEAAHLRRLPRDAHGKGPGHRADRHARPLARPADDRRRRGRRRRLRAEADQRRRGRGPGHGGRGPQAQARRAGRHAAAQHAAPDRGPRHASCKEGKLGKIGLVEIYCYYHMRARDNPPDTAPPENLDYEMWTGPAPMRPYNTLVHPRGWRAFMEYGNGIVGDMCIHMLDMVRWMLDLGWPQRVSLDRRHPGRQGTARPTSPTRRPPRSTSATCTSSGSTAPGASRPTRSIPGAPRSTATRAR